MPDSGSPHETWPGNNRRESVLASPRRSEAASEEHLVRLDGRSSLIAVSPAMREVLRQIERVAEIDATVLLIGESGAGKEVVARMIHKLSERSSRRFMKANCGLRPEELLESELFGFEAGARTGTQNARAGKLEMCHKDTILLDEIGELPASAQAKLLHVLQEGEVSRVGSASTTQLDLRVVAASSRDLRSAVESGRFRADLYYRLNIFAIHVPPLRERREDLPHLLNHLMTSWSARYERQRLPITRQILEACANYSWPGNVRELENFVKRYLVLGDQELALGELNFGAAPTGTTRTPVPLDMAGSNNSCDLKSLVRDLKQDAERAAIIQALEKAGGNRQDAASLLQISLRGLHYKMRAYGIDSSPSRARTCAGQRETAKLRPITFAARSVHPFPHSGGGKLITMDRAAAPPVR